MKKSFQIVFLALFLFSSKTFALGPVDGELNLNLWNNDFDADILDGELDAGSLTIDGDFWLFDKWGMRAAYYRADLEGSALDNRTRIQLEARRRFISVTDNSFIALGAGVEDINLETGQDTTGLRLSLEGRVALTPAVYFYGRYAVVPDLQDAGNLEDISSSEYEAGVRFTPFPFLHLKFGYLNYELDYDNTATAMSESTKSSGFILGAGVHW